MDRTGSDITRKMVECVPAACGLHLRLASPLFGMMRRRRRAAGAAATRYPLL
jgi:hypothetical protein